MFDKARGFVNGAIGTVDEPLRGNAVSNVKLHGASNIVLVYPVEEDGNVYIPCSYGYATAIQRAQGASLELGCLWFHKRRHAVGAIDTRCRLGTLLSGRYNN